MTIFRLLEISGITEEPTAVNGVSVSKVELAGFFGLTSCYFDREGNRIGSMRVRETREGLMEEVGIAPGTIDRFEVSCPKRDKDKCESCPNRTPDEPGSYEQPVEIDGRALLASARLSDSISTGSL